MWRFPVRVVVRIVSSDALAWEVFYCSLVETVCEGVGLCLSFAGVAGPAGGVHPFGAVWGAFAFGLDAVAGVD